ncbi:hypothetical protein HZH68_013862 [Vespula germanica]|uniref:Uncharacterized protein n=1 Tax=Vespula germanica TaxID=30212 RepID=A0A834JCK9_VESGE|nr:hypothetical protein HZH68_013862 [Vespula germanica]
MEEGNKGRDSLMIQHRLPRSWKKFSTLRTYKKMETGKGLKGKGKGYLPTDATGPRGSALAGIEIVSRRREMARDLICMEKANENLSLTTAAAAAAAAAAANAANATAVAAAGKGGCLDDDEGIEYEQRRREGRSTAFGHAPPGRVLNANNDDDDDNDLISARTKL